MAKRSKGTVRRAKTEEVAPAPVENEINPQWEHHFRRLMDLRAELFRRKGDLAKDAAEEQPAFSLHMADAATDNYDRDFALCMISSEQNALYEVEEALHRIRDGTYGICEATGKPIQSARLNAIPWTRFSAEAEKQLEERGAIAKTQLGDLARLPGSASAHGEEEE